MRQRLGRWWRWVTATRARRIALTLAVLAAIAAPFATGSYEANEVVLSHEVLLTPQDRAEIKELWGKGEDEDCEQAAKRLRQRVDSCDDIPRLRERIDSCDGVVRYYVPDWRVCLRDRRALETGSREEGYWPYGSPLNYLTLNGAIMLTVLTVTFFALTAAMAVVHKWWRWLW